jgi:uncharacterized protein
VRFWDSCALVPLLIREQTSDRLKELFRRDPEVALWWGTPIECASAFARLQREGRLMRSGVRDALEALDELRALAFEIQPLTEVRARAIRLVSVHSLRAGDALQLAAALAWCRERPQKVGFVSLDARLRLAASSERFQVLPYSEDVQELNFED